MFPPCPAEQADVSQGPARVIHGAARAGQRVSVALGGTMSVRSCWYHRAAAQMHGPRVRRSCAQQVHVKIHAVRRQRRSACDLGLDCCIRVRMRMLIPSSLFFDLHILDRCSARECRRCRMRVEQHHDVEIS